MPLNNNHGGHERASRLGHRPIVENTEIVAALSRLEYPSAGADMASLQARSFTHDDLVADDARDVELIIAIDGSMQEVPARDEYPSVRLGYIQVAGVIIDLNQMRASRVDGMVDPVKYRASINKGIFNVVLPGSNVYTPNTSSVDTFRRFVHEAFLDKKIDDGTSLSEILFRLYGHHPATPADTITVGRCPDPDCDNTHIDTPPAGTGCARCGTEVFPTDVFRLHTAFEPDGLNQTPFRRFMLLCEQVAALGYLSWLWATKRDMLPHIAFQIDGPLGLFGETAPLRTAIRDYLAGMHQSLYEEGIRMPVIVGVEKSGAWVDHAIAVGELLEPGTLLHPDLDYIHKHHLSTKPNPNYGRDEFYGRRFIYRCADGRRTIVFSVPRYAQTHLGAGSPYASPGCEQLDQYPTLRATLELIDRYPTYQFANAMMTSAAAHEYASIPLGTGSDVLRLLAQEALGIVQHRTTRIVPGR